MIKQGEYFCREVWPTLSIRSIFLKNCSINENNGITETLAMMTEMDSDNSKMNHNNEYKKSSAKEFLGYEIPDLGFMLASSIQWPSEYLKQI